MENVAEALKMAAAVLVFVLALSISINAFGEARQSAQIVLDYRDREYDYSYVEDNGGVTQRIVGLESIVPSIYKAYRENYKIVFDTTKIDKYEGIYGKQGKDGNVEPVFTIDLENETKTWGIGTDEQKEEFIQAILYGADMTTKTKFLTNSGIILYDKGIYDIIKENRYVFVEKLGIYYQEEVEGQSESPDTNKTPKRIITYTDN